MVIHKVISLERVPVVLINPKNKYGLLIIMNLLLQSLAAGCNLSITSVKRLSNAFKSINE